MLKSRESQQRIDEDDEGDRRNEQSAFELRRNLSFWFFLHRGFKVMAPFLLLLLIVLAARGLGAAAGLDAQFVREYVKAFGFWSPVVFVMIYIGGIVAQLPGSIFVGGAVLLYGPTVGFVLSYAAAFLANVLIFSSARITSGEAFVPTLQNERIQHFGVAKAWSMLSQRPFAGVVLIRLVLPTAAAVSVALAMTPVGFRSYAIGSMVGVVPQLLLTVGVFGWALYGMD